MNRQLTPLSRIAAAALATAAAAAISIAGLQQADGYGIGGLSVSAQTDIQKPGH